MTGVSPTPDNTGPHAKWGHFVGAATFLTLYMLGMFVLIGIFYNNMMFADHFTHLSEMPASSFYHSSRYSAQWWFLYWFAFFNLVMGYLFAAAICNNAQPMWAKVHKWWTGLTLFANIVFLIAFSIFWLFFCNTGYSEGSPCNSVNWCCSHFVDKPEWCQNVVPCVGAPGLSISTEFLAAWIYSIILIVVSWAFLSLNKHLWSVGMFMEVAPPRPSGDY